MKHSHYKWIISGSVLLVTVFVCLGLCFFSSCRNTAGEIPVIDMDRPAGSIDLHLSDLFDDITIVPIETQDDLLLEPRTNFTITNHYILAHRGDRLLQFDRQGKFIRTLALRGRGPNEFNVMANPLVDEERGLFYYVNNVNRETIACIDMNSGEFLGPYTPDIQPFSMQQMDSKGYVYGFRPAFDSSFYNDSLESQKSPILAFRFHPQNNDLTLYEGSRDIEGSYHLVGYGNSRMFNWNDTVFFMIPTYSDTLFKIVDDRIVPHYVFKLKNKMVDQKLGGMALDIHFSGQCGVMFTKKEIIIEYKDGSVSGAGGRPVGYLFLDNNRNLKTINSLTIEALGLTIPSGRSPDYEIPMVPIVTGIHGYFRMLPKHVITLANQMLKGNQISNDQRKRYEELVTTLKEDDNIVLIVGNVK